ncbi:hypothetical protein SAMN06298224_1229 [Fibrobacter sp. UWB16]|uniref:hypothetical protein n=1 Tax=unclassified Fibrobacter TaxID=2634177 RepID=UPI000B5239CD|nr:MULTISPECIES: hypothetical protein [unclassified Fibrobacter]OWV18533.1 hypothetical protein B7991_09975 [Fibrobacter sp. UWB3]SOD13506.1 hypothetical protein SAMN06298224_1229 [Fibrobacter sp. UWB16]
MNRKQKVVMLATLALGGLFAGCSKSEPIIACGREWNPAVGYVADTGSVFRMADELIIQLRYGTGFDFNTLKFAFYEGSLTNKGEKLWEHDFRVTNKMEAFTLEARSRRGGYATAREMTKLKAPGTVVVEVSSERGLIAAKQLSIVNQ